MEIAKLNVLWLATGFLGRWEIKPPKDGFISACAEGSLVLAPSGGLVLLGVCGWWVGCVGGRNLQVSQPLWLSLVLWAAVPLQPT